MTNLTVLIRVSVVCNNRNMSVDSVFSLDIEFPSLSILHVDELSAEPAQPMIADLGGLPNVSRLE